MPKHNPVYNVVLHEPFFVESLNRAVLAENQSIKAYLETFSGHFLRNVSHFPWPDPMSLSHSTCTPSPKTDS
jgi:hypothetical protein